MNYSHMIDQLFLVDELHEQFMNLEFHELSFHVQEVVMNSSRSFHWDYNKTNQDKKLLAIRLQQNKPFIKVVHDNKRL